MERRSHLKRAADINAHLLARDNIALELRQGRASKSETRMHRLLFGNLSLADDSQSLPLALPAMTGNLLSQQQGGGPLQSFLRQAS